jgi:hypothetical protein
VAPRLVVLGGSRSVLNPGDPGVDGGLFSGSSCTSEPESVRHSDPARGSREAGPGRGARWLTIPPAEAKVQWRWWAGSDWVGFRGGERRGGSRLERRGGVKREATGGRDGGNEQRFPALRGS